MSTLYVLIELDESAPILERTPDGEEAAEALYLDELNRRLKRHGITALEVEMIDRSSGALSDAIFALGLK